MRKIHYGWISFWAFVFLGIGIVGHIQQAKGDTGWEGATRIENGSFLNTTQISVSTTATTTIVSASKDRPCLFIKNIDPQFQVYLGSSTGVTVNSGYALDTSTSANSTLRLYNFNGSIEGKGQATGGTAVPKVAVAECVTK